MLISDMEEYFQKDAPKNVVPEDRSPKKITHKNVFFVSNFVIFRKYSYKSEVSIKLEFFLYQYQRI
jgi:hypothetical protein